MKLFISVAFLCTSNTSLAQAELFSEADEDTISIAKEQNAEYLIQQLYIAKKHQFLVLNPDVFQQESLQISFFDHELSLEQSKPVDRSRGSYTWEGQNTVYKEKLYEYYGIKNSEVPMALVNKKAIADQFSSIQFSVGKIFGYVDRYGDTIYKQKGDTDEIDFSLPGNEKPREITTVYSNFTYFGNGSQYILQPLPNTPDVHLLVEFNRDKSFVSIDGDPTEKMRRNRQNYHAYLRQNGYGHLIKKSNNNPAEIKRSRIKYLTEQGIQIKDPKRRELFYKRLETARSLNKKDIERLILDIKAHFNNANEPNQ